MPTKIDAIREDASVSTAAALAISNGRAPRGWSIEDDGDGHRFRTMQNGVPQGPQHGSHYHALCWAWENEGRVPLPDRRTPEGP